MQLVRLRTPSRLCGCTHSVSSCNSHITSVSSIFLSTASPLWMCESLSEFSSLGLLHRAINSVSAYILYMSPRITRCGEGSIPGTHRCHARGDDSAAFAGTSAEYSLLHVLMLQHERFLPWHGRQHYSCDVPGACTGKVSLCLGRRVLT